MDLVAVLNNIRSIHNVGSIFRTADGAGVRKIYLCGITPTPADRFGKLLPQFTKVALGAEKSVEWEKISSTLRAIKKLKADGYAIFAIEQDKKSVPYYRVRSRGSGAKKIALIVGNEVRGLPPSILENCDKILEIPMLGKKESLNVSVAFGVAAYRLRLPS